MKKRKKINLKKLIIILFIIIILYLIISYLLSIKIRNIVILNNNYYSDDQIIEQAGLYNYPRFITLNKRNVKNKLKKLDLIEDVNIDKKLGFVLKIDVKEKKILYFIRSKNEYMASDNKSYKIDNVIGYPTLINYVPEKVEESFVKELSKVNTNIVKMISEIEYSKTQFDEKRFLLYMNDGNEVYITVTKVDVLNKYVDIVKKLNKKNGILYLDSGNYFEVK